jgi:N4-gp56 family major capsid protein
MATTQTTALITAELQTYYDKKLLSRLIPNFVYANLGQKRSIPKGNGKTIDFRKFASLTAATTALTEGTTPAGNSITVTNTTATVSQYGDFVEVSDFLDLVAIDPVIDEMANVFGEQCSDTIDQVVRDVLAAGTVVQYAAGRVSRVTVAAGDNFSVTELRKAIRTLRGNNAKPMSDGYYVAVISPNTLYDLQGDSSWVNAHQYTDIGIKDLYKGEAGMLYGVRFIVTTNAKVFSAAGAAGINVHATIILGQEAFGLIDVAGGAACQMIIKPHGASGTADPLNQRGTIGWKVNFVAKILQQNAMIRIEHAVSA